MARGCHWNRWHAIRRILGWVGLAVFVLIVALSLGACQGQIDLLDPVDANSVLRLSRGPGGCIQRRYNADKGWHWGVGSCRVGLRDQ